MPHAAYRYAVIIERIARDALKQLDGLSEEVLNRTVPIPEANHLYALATHLAGAGEFWAVTVPGNRTTNRDRPAEFRANGTLADLTSLYDRWLAELHAVLDALPDAELDRTVDPALYPNRIDANESLTVRDCLLHAVEHSALHLGHIQLTTQMFRNGVW